MGASPFSKIDPSAQYSDCYQIQYQSTDDHPTDQLLWSIQSEAYNPTDIDTWFDKYSYDLLNELKDEGLITK